MPLQHPFVYCSAFIYLSFVQATIFFFKQQIVHFQCNMCILNEKQALSKDFERFSILKTLITHIDLTKNEIKKSCHIHFYKCCLDCIVCHLHETHHGKEIHHKNGLLGILNMSLLRLVQNCNVKNGITA